MNDQNNKTEDILKFEKEYKTPNVNLEEENFIDNISGDVDNRICKSGGSLETSINNREDKEKIVCEDVARRKANEKHYRMSDGSYRAVLFGEPVHYYDEKDGHYKEINNDLCEESAVNEEDFDGYVNRKGELSIKIAREAGDKDLISIQKGIHKLAWRLAVNNAENLRDDETDVQRKIGTLNKHKSPVKQKKTEARHSPEKELYLASVNEGNNEVIFEDITEGVDIQFILNNNELKENIIIKEQREAYEYEFEIKTKNLNADVKEDGSIEFYINKLVGGEDEYSREVVFLIPPPYMYDASGETSSIVRYELSRLHKGYSLRIIAEPEWINSPDRIFPVTVDPTVEIYSGRLTGINKEFLYKSDGSYINFSDPFSGGGVNVLIGKKGIFGGSLVAPYSLYYMEIDTETEDTVSGWIQNLFGNNKLNDVKMYVSVAGYNGGNDSQTVEVRSVRDVSDNGTNMYHKIRNSEHVKMETISKEYMADSIEDVLEIDLTRLFDDWVECDSNSTPYRPIIVFTTTSDNPDFYLETSKPVFIFNYTPKEYIRAQTYDTSALRAGNCSVDLYTGNLFFTHHDISSNDQCMPISLYHTYSNMNNGSCAGKKWNLNIHQYLYNVGDETNPDDYSHKIYVDSYGVYHTLPVRFYCNVNVDGTVHKKYGSKSELIEQYGADQVLYEYSNGEFTYYFDQFSSSYLEDKYANRMYFHVDYNYLTMIDNSESRTFIEIYRDRENEYGGNEHTIVFIHNGEGSCFDINYYSAGFISSIVDRNNEENSLYYFYNTAGELTEIRYGSYNSSNKTSFSYSGGNLVNVIDQSGYELEFAYKNSKVDLIRKLSNYNVIRYDVNTEAGTFDAERKQHDIVNIDYFKNTTFVKDENGVRQGYIFKNDGTLKTAFEHNGSINNINKLNIGNNVSFNNVVSGEEFTLNVVTTYSLSRTPALQNYVKNPGFETNTVWEGSFSRNNSYTVTGDYSGAVTNGKLSQRIYKNELPEIEGDIAEFSLSGWAKADSYLTNGNGKFEIRYILRYSDALNLQSGEVQFDRKNKEWQHAAVPIIIKNYSDLEHITIIVDYSDNRGVCYFDEICLCRSRSTVNKITESLKIESQNDTLNTVSYFDKDNNITHIEYKDEVSSVIYNQYNAYDSRNRLISKELAGLKTQYTYNEQSQILEEKVTDMLQNKEMAVSNIYNDHQLRTKDFRNKETVYNFDLSSYLMTNMVTPSGQQVQYTYEKFNSMVSKISTAYTNTNGAGSVLNNTYSYNKGFLTRINQDGFSYYFEYDGMGRPTRTLLEDKTLLTIEYFKGADIHNITGAIRTKKVSYANGNTFLHYYDKYDRLILVRYSETNKSIVEFNNSAYNIESYTYNYKQQLEKVYDYKNNTTYTYAYDDLGNPTSVKQTLGSSSVRLDSSISYDAYGRSSAETHKIDNSTTLRYGYSYDDSLHNTINGIAVADGDDIKIYSYEYDGFKRMTGRSIRPGLLGAARYKELYTYVPNGSRTTPLVNAVEYKFDNTTTAKLSYTYDDEGNISEIRNLQGALTHKFLYDKINRLIREDIPGYKIVLYTYDNRGNLLSRKEYAYNSENASRSVAQLSALTPVKQFDYGYKSSGAEKNRLISFNGKTLPKEESAAPVMASFAGYSFMALASGGSGSQGSGSTGSGNQGSGSQGGGTPGGNGSGGSGSGSNNPGSGSGGNGSGSGSGSGGSDPGTDPITPVQNDEYDANGNPLHWFRTLNGNTTVPYELAWEKGRQLKEIKEGEQRYRYTYNSDGIRTKKEENGITYEYYLNGSTIIGERRTGEGTDILLTYHYDINGISGFRYRNNITGASKRVYYRKNIQGDIIGILDGEGETLVTYVYDAWGNILLSSGNAELQRLNPFMYRGYYRDKETGWYYLNSRYYDPSVCRFINADDVRMLDEYTLCGLNLYVYCGNNPVVKKQGIIFKERHDISLAIPTVDGFVSIISILKPSLTVTSFIHWKSKWFDTDWPNFIVLSNEGLELVNWGLSVYKGNLYFDKDENHSIYASVGNISAYAGINYKKGIGIDGGASVVSIGYDGRIIDASVDVLTIGATYMYKDGKVTYGLGYGVYGFSVSIDFVELFKIIFGGS